ncbi:MAG TPA: hypothetical protein VGP24_14560 [Glaciihabitans sp.]|jgi:hypothetical protein|nr:hypothetical protein [Glaciihabitans sp.]
MEVKSTYRPVMVADIAVGRRVGSGAATSAQFVELIPPTASVCARIRMSDTPDFTIRWAAGPFAVQEKTPA